MQPLQEVLSVNMLKRKIVSTLMSTYPDYKETVTREVDSWILMGYYGLWSFNLCVEFIAVNVNELNCSSPPLSQSHTHMHRWLENGSQKMDVRKVAFQFDKAFSFSATWLHRCSSSCVGPTFGVQMKVTGNRAGDDGNNEGVSAHAVARATGCALLRAAEL